MLPRSGDTEGDLPEPWLLASTCSVLRGPSAAGPGWPRPLISRGLWELGAVFAREGDVDRWPAAWSSCSGLLSVLKYHQNTHNKPSFQTFICQSIQATAIAPSPPQNPSSAKKA